MGLIGGLYLIQVFSKLEVGNMKKGKNSIYNLILKIREEVEQAEKVKTCVE